MKGRWLVALVAAFPTLVTAGNYCDPCCDPCTRSWGFQNLCNGRGEMFVEALYLRPSTCDLTYAIHDPTFNEAGKGDNPRRNNNVPQGTELGFCPDYHWGFRIGGGYITCGNRADVRVAYSRVAITEKRRDEVGPNDGALWIALGDPAVSRVFVVTAFNGLPGTVDASATLEWYELQLQFAKRMEDCGRLVRVYAGIQWTDLLVRRDAFFVNPTTNNPVEFPFDHINQRTRTWGIGPRVGADARLELFCGLGVGAQAGMALLTGEGQFRRVDEDGNLPAGIRPFLVNNLLNVKYHTRCMVFSEFDARLGLNYAWCCGNCLTGLFEVGYEFRTYLSSVLQPIFYSDVQPGANHLTCDSFGLNGLYIRLEVTF